MPDRLTRWADAYTSASFPVQCGIVVGLTALAFTVSLLVIALLPHDYFATTTSPATSWWRQHPVVRFGLVVFKNLLGVVMLAVGTVMLIGPGPGIVVFLLGISLLDVPGKRALERRLLRRPGVLEALNRLRARLRRSPFVLDVD